VCQPPGDRPRLLEALVIVTQIGERNLYRQLLDKVRTCRFLSLTSAEEMLQVAYARPFPEPNKEVYIRTVVSVQWYCGQFMFALWSVYNGIVVSLCLYCGQCTFTLWSVYSGQFMFALWSVYIHTVVSVQWSVYVCTVASVCVGYELSD